MTRNTNYGHVVLKHLAEEAAIDALKSVLQMPNLTQDLELPSDRWIEEGVERLTQIQTENI
jgi:hypothetical protein